MRFLSAVFATLLIVSACAKDPSEGVAAAKVGTAPAAPAKAPKAPAKADKPASAAADTAAPGAESQVKLTGDIIFVGSKVTGSHANKFNSWSGTATVDSTGLKGINITVKTADITADFEAPTKWSVKLENHLREDDFFASAKHPTATFALDKVVPASDKTGGASHDLSGTLTIRGISKAIQFPATISSTQPFAARAEFAINRKDFNMTYDGKADNLIRDNVVLKIDLKAAP